MKNETKKFRVWDTELKFFGEQSVYYICMDGSIWFNNCSDGSDEMTDQSYKLIVEESTGLFDKNGNEIYEGDILSDMYGLEVVFFNKEMGVLAVKDEDGNSIILSNYSTSMAKIGNIHENGA